MKKSIALAAVAVAILLAPVTFAGGRQQNPKEKPTKVEKKEARSNQKTTADGAKKHHKKEKKD